MKANELKAKWRKDIDKDFIRELQGDGIRLRDKEKANANRKRLQGGG